MKTIKKICLLLFVAFALSLTSCSDDNSSSVNCDEIWTEYENAGDAYSENDSATNCTRYKSALNAVLSNIDACGGVEEVREGVISELNRLSC